MTAQNKILLALLIVAAIAIGAYALRVLPSYFSASRVAAPSINQSPKALPFNQIRGNPNASKTIIEFGDLECQTCGDLDPQIATLIKQEPDVRLVWKDCPSSSHPNAIAAAEAAACAGDQGKYWEYHDLLIQNQDQLGTDLYPSLAATLKMNVATFASCLESGTKRAQVSASIVECANADVAELPTFFINGKAFSGAKADVIHELTVELSKQ